MSKGREYIKEYLNENVFLQRVIKHKIRSKRLKCDLKVLCKKYKDVDLVVKWCKDNWSGYDDEIHLNIIKHLVNSCKNKDLYVAPNVDVTKSEIDKIKSLKTEKGREYLALQKLAFMLLILSKIIGFFPNLIEHRINV